MRKSGTCRGEPADPDALKCVSCLERAMQRPALLARTAMDLGAAGSEAPLAAAKKVCDAYDAFLGLLADENQREELSGSSSFDGPAFNRGRTLSHYFADGLQEFFFGSDKNLSLLTQLYGVF